MSATVQNPQDVRSFGPSQGLVSRIADALRAAYAGRHAAKRIANDADTSPRTVEAWLAARNAPHAADLIGLMARNDELERQVLALVRDIRERAHCPTTVHSGSAPGAGNTCPATPSTPTMAG